MATAQLNSTRKKKTRWGQEKWSGSGHAKARKKLPVGVGKKTYLQNIERVIGKAHQTKGGDSFKLGEGGMVSGLGKIRWQNNLKGT